MHYLDIFLVCQMLNEVEMVTKSTKIYIIPPCFIQSSIINYSCSIHRKNLLLQHFLFQKITKIHDFTTLLLKYLFFLYFSSYAFFFFYIVPFVPTLSIIHTVIIMIFVSYTSCMLLRSTCGEQLMVQTHHIPPY